ncbi:MAG: hypothetical protein H7Y37_08360 [Anaerolineae bacterium]|nr:hypothetical protein [Gloeobacterales cyanobacterium ES-bin-313]
MNAPPPSIARLLSDLSDLVDEEDQAHPLSEIFRRFESVDWKTENLGDAGEALLLSAKLLRLRAMAIENPNLLTTDRLMGIFEDFTRTQSDYSGLNKLTYQGTVRPRGRLPGKSVKGFYKENPNILEEWLPPKQAEPMPTTIEEIQELAYEERMNEEVERLVAFIQQPYTLDDVAHAIFKGDLAQAFLVALFTGERLERSQENFYGSVLLESKIMTT